ncbi:PAS domain-containing protein [Clostridium sporogenes]
MNIPESPIPIKILSALLLNNINDGVNIVDSNGILVYVNDISSNYVGVQPEQMIGYAVSKFYPNAPLEEVVKTHQAVINRHAVYPDGRKYLASAYPLFNNGKFCGVYAVFKSLDDIEALNRKKFFLEQQLQSTNKKVQCPLIGADSTLKDILIKARKSVGAPGGPRHSVITGP